MLREGMIVTVHHDCGVVTGPYRIIEVQGGSHLVIENELSINLIMLLIQ